MVLLRRIYLLSVLLIAATFVNAQTIIDGGVKYLLNPEYYDAIVIGNDHPENVVINQFITYDNNEYWITAINDRAFKGATTLKSVDLSNASTLMYIGTAIFADCSNLEEVIFPAELPNDICQITDSMFYGCSALSTVQIPEGMSTIGDYAFNKCSNLKTITLYGYAPPSLADNSFSDDIYEKAALYVTDVDMYRDDRNWNSFVKIYPINPVVLPSEELEISLEHETYYYNGSEIKPKITVKWIKDEQETLIDADEYTVSYANNINAGTATLTLTDKEGGNYIVSGSKTFTIGKVALTISAGYYEIFEGDAIPELTVSYDGFKNNETEAVLTTKPIVSCIATINSEPGEYTISVSGAEADNYNITHQNGKLIIMALKFESGGDSSNEEDDKASYQITSKGSDGTSTPTVVIIDDKDVSGAFAIPEQVTYHDKTYMVTEIAEGAFENNKNLTDVVIPSSISGIGDKAFKGCKNLQSITLFIPTPINLYSVGARGLGTMNDGTSVFDGVDKATCVLLVPDASVDLYKAAPVWNEFQHIVPMSKKDILKCFKIIRDYIMTGNCDGINLDDVDQNDDGKVNVADLVLIINELK